MPSAKDLGPGQPELPKFTLFNTRSHLEAVPIVSTPGLAVLMPNARNAMSFERFGDDDEVLVEVEHVLMTTEEGFAGRYEVTGFAVREATGMMLTPAAIRSMPLADIFSRALLRSEGHTDGSWDDLLQLVGPRVVRRGGLTGDLILELGLDNAEPNEYERDALVYTLAKLYGRDTNRAVAEHRGITPADAAQHVRFLRRHHFLPPASRQGARRS